MNLLDHHISDGVMTITMNDIDRRNALSREMLDELVTTFDEAERAPDVRVVVLTNAGPVFCAGADLSERTGADDRPMMSLDVLFERVRHSAKPYVGRINGHCVAGGMGLAAVMDISVAVDTATFGFTEVRVGVAPAMISVVCLAKMRPADARSAFLRANRFGAARAAEMGLINEAVSADVLDGTVDNIVNDLLAGGPTAIAATKSLMVRVPELSLDDAAAWTAELSARLFAGDEAREGMTAFLEKRPASWVRRLSNDSDE